MDEESFREWAIVGLSAALVLAVVLFTIVAVRHRRELAAYRRQLIAPGLILHIKRVARFTVVLTVVNAGTGWLHRGHVTVVLEGTDSETSTVRTIPVPALAPGEDIEFLPDNRAISFESFAATMKSAALEWTGADVAGRELSGRDSIDIEGWCEAMRRSAIRDAPRPHDRIANALDRIAKSVEQK